MKKAWAFALLGILLLLIACTKQETAETDLIFEGKTYVVGSGKPPKGQPKKMLIKQSYNYYGNTLYEIVDSFYTNKEGFFNYRFKPNLEPKRYVIIPEPSWSYDNIDILNPQRLGLHKQDFRIISGGTLRLRLKNENYHFGDSLVMTDANNFSTSFAGPLAIDFTMDFSYPAFINLKFEFLLRRNGLITSWQEYYLLNDDSTHYHEVIF